MSKEIKSRPMRLLLVEDDHDDVSKFTECVKKRKDVQIIGITNSSDEAMKIIKSRLPEGIILNLQLVRGKGTGIRLLEFLKNTELTIRPIVVVTTSNQSQRVYRSVEAMGADFYFNKTTEGYDETVVLDTLVFLRPYIELDGKRSPREGNVRDMVESPEELRDRVYRRIDLELDLVGLRTRLKGRDYLREAIYFQMYSTKERGSGIEDVADMEKKQYGSIAKAMQTSINDAWKRVDIDEVFAHFTARITAKTGVPYVSDFIHFYADKIKRTI
jgi:response regulator RpfG family c-di-GMP phosphodiesterase